MFEIGVSALVIFAGVVGYFGRRYVERRGTVERLDRTVKVLDIHERMQRSGLSPSDLSDIEDLLLAKSVRLRNIENIALSERAPSADEIVTQAEMNQQAYNAFSDSDGKLESVLKIVREELSDDLLTELEKSQEAWTIYRNAQADLLAKQYEGGSIQPLIRATELERLTISRRAEIEDFLNEQRRL